MIEDGLFRRDLRFYGATLFLVVLFVALCTLSYHGAQMVYRVYLNEPDVSVIGAVPTRPAVIEETISTFVPQMVRGAEVDPETNYVFNQEPRVIERLTIESVIPKTGKIIIADLKEKQLSLYENATRTAQFPIITFGRPGTPWETPAGLYSIHTKEPVHFSTIGKVYMPYSMEFYGNYFIHGRTYYPDGTLTSATFSGGCIKLDTADAEQVFDFADIGTQVFVYDPKPTEELPVLTLKTAAQPSVSATSYVVADLDTGDVYLDKDAQTALPIASLTKLMTALVANETISFNKNIVLASTSEDPVLSSAQNKLFVVGDLMYPLLMSSSDGAAISLSSYIGKSTFVRWMNNAAHAFHMEDTKYHDALGASEENLSTADDLFRLAHYIAKKKSFIFAITAEDEKKISALDGTSFTIKNGNDPVSTEPFRGGKAGMATAPHDAMLSLLTVPYDGKDRTMVIAVLGSEDGRADTSMLADWITHASEEGASLKNAACVSCTTGPSRKIDLP